MGPHSHKTKQNEGKTEQKGGWVPIMLLTRRLRQPNARLISKLLLNSKIVCQKLEPALNLDQSVGFTLDPMARWPNGSLMMISTTLLPTSRALTNQMKSWLPKNGTSTLAALTANCFVTMLQLILPTVSTKECWWRKLVLGASKLISLSRWFLWTKLCCWFILSWFRFHNHKVPSRGIWYCFNRGIYRHQCRERESNSSWVSQTSNEITSTPALNNLTLVEKHQEAHGLNESLLGYNDYPKQFLFFTFKCNPTFEDTRAKVTGFGHQQEAQR